MCLLPAYSSEDSQVANLTPLRLDLSFGNKLKLFVLKSVVEWLKSWMDRVVEKLDIII